MKLGSFLKSLKKYSLLGDKELSIQDIAYHTRQVKPGCCFVAIKGLQSDGHQYVPEAIKKGAQVVVVERDILVNGGVTKIVVDDSRDALARMSADFFKEPTKKLRLVGITGTNGKTTTAGIIESIWKVHKRKTGLLTTVCYRWGNKEMPALRTTPESYDLQKMFADMVEEKVQDCVMEVTSHAIDLKRVVACHFDGAIFTNLSQDHLDYHKNMESYFACKARLFRERLVVSEKKSLWAAINWDDPYGRTLCGGLPAKVFRFSAQKDSPAESRIKKMEVDWTGLKLEVTTPRGEIQLTSPMIGMFNVYNILAALSSALAMEIPSEKIALGIADFHGMPGRLEKISAPGFHLFVDYAHTPAALENVLRTLKELRPKRILTVFGCGGNRDHLKRPMMGEVVERLSDVVIVTSDNPRDEDPLKIIEEIKKGFKKSDGNFVIADRKEAIAKAMHMAQEGDCVLIAGKGHETYQEVKGVLHPFDDRLIAKEILNGV